MRPYKKNKKKVISNKVIVGDMSFEQAMRLFKRKTKKSGIIGECKRREYFVSKGRKTKLRKDAAIRRYKRSLSKNVGRLKN